MGLSLGLMLEVSRTSTGFSGEWPGSFLGHFPNRMQAANPILHRYEVGALVDDMDCFLRNNTTRSAQGITLQEGTDVYEKRSNADILRRKPTVILPASIEDLSKILEDQLSVVTVIGNIPISDTSKNG